MINNNMKTIIIMYKVTYLHVLLCYVMSSVFLFMVSLYYFINSTVCLCVCMLTNDSIIF